MPQIVSPPETPAQPCSCRNSREVGEGSLGQSQGGVPPPHLLLAQSGWGGGGEEKEG